MKKRNLLTTVLAATFVSALALGGVAGTGLVAEAAETLPEESAKIIEITMSDSYKDGWNGAAIEIYADGILTKTLTVPDEEESYAWSMAYDSSTTYVFKWTQGEYDDECSFTISVSEQVAYSSIKGCDDYKDGETFYVLKSSCEHAFEEDSVCTVCEKTCGVQFPHEMDETTCLTCGFECGEDVAHDWNQKNGVCNVCETACEHIFENNVCTICTLSYVAEVSDADGGKEIYLTLQEALEEAKYIENSTVKLIKNVSIEEIYIDNTEGTLTFDLNGYTLTLTDWGLRVENSSNVKIVDTSVSQTGKLQCTYDFCSPICVYDDATLEINGGTITDLYGGTAIDSSHSGNATNATVIISGGTILGDISHMGKNLTITGGTLVVEEAQDIYWHTGTIDLSQYNGVSNIDFSISNQADVSKLTLKLPEDYVVRNESGDEGLKAGYKHTIHHTNCTYTFDCQGVCNVCKQETRESTHEGGEVTCKERAICNTCSEPYGSLNLLHTIENRVCTVCTQEAKLTATLKNGTTIYFVTLDEAFTVLEEQKSAATIVLNGNMDVTEAWSIDNDYTIELNGYQINFINKDLAIYGNVIINDSSEAQTGKITVEEYYYIFYVTGSLVINGGEMNGAITVGGNEENEASVIVNNGTFTGRYGIDVIEYATVTVYNGVFDTKEEIFYLDHGTLIVYNASFTDGGYAIYYDEKEEKTFLLPLDSFLSSCSKAYDAEGNVLTLDEGFEVEAGAEIKATHTGGTATCAEKAVCTVCGTSYGQLLEHAWDEGEITKTPTCSAKGEKTYTCTHNSEHTKTEDVAIDENAHSFGDWTVTKEATETENGARERSCICGAKETEAIPATGVPVKPDQKKGCGSSITDGALGGLTLLGSAAVVFLKKRKEN